MASSQQQNTHVEQQDVSTNTDRSMPLPSSIMTMQRERGFDLILIPGHKEECRKPGKPRY